MKLLVVTTSYPAHDADPSGHFVRTEARLLARSGASQVHVVVPSATSSEVPEQDPREPRLFVHRVFGGSLFGWPGVAARLRDDPRRLFYLAPLALSHRRALARIGRVDKAFAHWIVPSAFPLLTFARMPLEVIAHGADVRLLCSSPLPLRSFVLQNLLSRGASFRFVAKASLDALVSTLDARLGDAISARSRVEPVALEVPDVGSRGASLRASIGLHDPHARLVVVVGRLVPSKRVDLALRAAKLAGMSIVVVGDGPSEASLRSLARDLSVDAHFVGLLPREDALAWISAADLLGFVSEKEASPTVVREARALGVPVVACDAGDLKAWAASDAHIRVVPSDPAALAACFSQVAALFGWGLRPRMEVCSER